MKNNEAFRILDALWIEAHETVERKREQQADDYDFHLGKLVALGFALQVVGKIEENIDES